MFPFLLVVRGIRGGEGEKRSEKESNERKGKVICLVETERMQYKVACLTRKIIPSSFLPSSSSSSSPSPLLPVTLNQGARNLHATTLGLDGIYRHDEHTWETLKSSLVSVRVLTTTIKLTTVCLFGLIKSISFNCQLELLDGKYVICFSNDLWGFRGKGI